MIQPRNAAQDDKYTYVSELGVHRCFGADAAFKREKSKKRVKYVSDTYMIYRNYILYYVLNNLIFIASVYIVLSDIEIYITDIKNFYFILIHLLTTS